MPGSVPSPRVPSYRLHKPSGLAVVRLSGRDFYLGPHGSPESHDAYKRVVAEWLANYRQPVQSAAGHAGQALSVGEVFLAYW